MIAAITLFLVVTLSVLITKIASIALAHTGLSSQIARFQARSAYTGTGFCTSESEKIMNHPVRRKIIYSLMLVGNAGIVTVISSLVLTFILPESMLSKFYAFLIVVCGISIIWWAIKSNWVDRGLSKIINNMLRRYTDIEIQDYAAVLHLKDNYKISEKKVGAQDWMANKTLKELRLRDEGITILGIDRQNKEYVGSPTGSFKILPEDVITIYGKADVIKNLYKRQRDFSGEREHADFVKKEDSRKKEQEPDSEQSK
ncbi:MAG TPA: potassium transporter TrkA [Leeuwenhoekiella sp.]|nr:potassium transporter TrkA [Leeuwenhoekiella sp.]